MTFWKWNDNLIVLFELWRSILKMDMFYCKNRSPLHSWDYLVSNLVILVVSFIISTKNLGVLNFFLCVYYYEITRDNELRPAAFLITLILLGPCSNSAPLSSLDVCTHPPTRSLASSKIIWNIHYMYMFCNVTCVSNLLHHYQSLEKLSEIEVYVL